MGFTNRFRGRSAFQSMSVQSGGYLDTASGVAGSLQGVIKIPVIVTAVANTDLTAAVPPGSTILSATFYTTTAFTAATITCAIGSAAAGAQYVAAVSVINIGVVAMTLVNAGAPGLASMPALNGAGKNLFVRLAQGTPTAVGAGVLVIEYA